MNSRKSKLRAIPENVDDVVERILEQTIDRCSFIHYISRQWENRRFVMHFDYHNSTVQKQIDQYTKHVKPTFHGRANQPESTSHSLFGGKYNISSRLVFDPPTNRFATEGIEPHTHSVASLIVATKGSGDFFLLFSHDERNFYIRVPLAIGTVVCFPAGVIHTMSPGKNGIQTFNITDKENLAPLRESQSSQCQKQSQFKSEIEAFSVPGDIPKNTKCIDYMDFLNLE